MAARELRHAFLARVARQVKANAVALAHHADDQVELFFLRLLRGAGGEGLAGMKFRSPSPAERQVTLLRPLLSVPKAVLRAHAAGQGIRYREDLSNAALVLKRNRVRHELLPLLARHYQPAIGEVIHRTIQVLGDETEYVRQAAARWLAARRRGRFGRIPRAVQRQVIQLQLIALGVMPGFDLVEQLRSGAGRTIPGAGDALLRRRADGVIERVAPDETAFRGDTLCVELAGRRRPMVLGKVEIRWSLRRCEIGAPRPRFGPGFEYFDAGKVGSAITLRHWRPGDRFQPIGMRTEVKLQDLFTNARIPRADRRGLVVAATARGEVFWVEGLRIGERFKLDKSTRSLLKWRWRRRAGRVAVARRA
jgi:tRNA(Ile)-lysidine synthase